MAPSTRGQSTQTSKQPAANPPPTTAKRGRAQKRKTPSDEEDPAPAEGPTSTESAPRSKPKPKARKGRTTATAAPTESPLVGDAPIDTAPTDSSQDAPAPSTEGVSINTNLHQPAETSTSGQGNSSGASGSGGDSAATIDSLRKELRAMKKFKVMWAKQQQEQNVLPNEGGPSVPEGSIPRPPGERGKNGWNMQTALQLEADGDMYNLILATARDAVRETGLDWKKKFDEQDPVCLGTCYSQMKHVQPYLRRFKGDWACRELVISTLQNRQKVEHARVKALMVRSPSKPSKSKRTGFKPRSKSASTASPAEELVNDEEVQEGGGEEL